MSSIAKPTKRRKKTRRLGPVRVLRPEQHDAFPVETKVECIRALIPLGLLRLHELLEEEGGRSAGVRYARKSQRYPGRRHGSKVVTHLDGPPYLLVDRSTRVQAGSVDAPHQVIERQLNEHLKRLGQPGDLATIPSVLEKNANLGHDGHRIFGY